MSQGMHTHGGLCKTIFFVYSIFMAFQLDRNLFWAQVMSEDV